MSLQKITLTSGRELHVKQLLIKDTYLEYVYCEPDRVRDDILKKIRARVSKCFGLTGLLMREPPGVLPAYTVHLELESYSPVTEGDCSALVIVWFTETLPDSVQAEIDSQVRALDWDAHAVDGNY